MDEFVKIQLCGNKLLVFDLNDVERLRCQHRIVGSLIGPLSRFPQQNSFHGLPLLLSPEEATLLLKKNIAILSSDTTWKYPDTRLDHIRCAVFEYLWRKEMYITSGLKFGGDFLAYPGDPTRFHSHHIVMVRERHARLKILDIINMGRLATNAKKTFILASSSEDEKQVEAFSIQWAGF